MKRIEIEREGHIAVLIYTTDESTLSIWHVETPLALRGKGLGGELVERARTIANERGLRLNPICSFARHHLEKREERSRSS